MFLILEDQRTEFSKKLQQTAKNRGLKTLIISSEEIAHNLSLSFFLSNTEVKIKFYFKDFAFNDDDIDGIYCSINAFRPEIWSNFSADDSEYAAKESQALWLAILSSFSSRTINPPALDTLAGTVLSIPETLNVARKFGFQIATSITVESGKIASEFLEKYSPAIYTDLGQIWLTETELKKNNIIALRENKNHYRIIEKLIGKPIHVTVLGRKIFACTFDELGSLVSFDSKQISPSIITQLRSLQKKLNLNLAEYHFHIMKDGGWVFSGMSRPPVFSTIVFDKILFNDIIKFALRKRKLW